MRFGGGAALLLRLDDDWPAGVRLTATTTHAHTRARAQVAHEELRVLREAHDTTAGFRTQIAALRNQIAVLAPLVGREDLASIKEMVRCWRRTSQWRRWCQCGGGGGAKWTLGNGGSGSGGAASFLLLLLLPLLFSAPLCVLLTALPSLRCARSACYPRLRTSLALLLLLPQTRLLQMTLRPQQRQQRRLLLLTQESTPAGFPHRGRRHNWGLLSALRRRRCQQERRRRRCRPRRWRRRCRRRRRRAWPRPGSCAATTRCARSSPARSIRWTTRALSCGPPSHAWTS